MVHETTFVVLATGMPKPTSSAPSTTTSSLAHDCKTAYFNWVEAWSLSRKVWCCKNYGRGCPVTTTSPPYDCVTRLSNQGQGSSASKEDPWLDEWSLDKKVWCCLHF